MTTTERLAEIDRELDAFQKSEERLAAVRARARETSPRGLAAIDAALEALGDGVATRPELAGSASTRPERPVTKLVETQTPRGMSARPASWDERPPIRDAEGSGLVELADDLIRREDLPAVLTLDEDEPPTRTHEKRAGFAASDLAADAVGESTDVRDPNSLEQELELEGGPQTEPPSAGMTRSDEGLAHLFDDTPQQEAVDAAAAGGIADLFESDRPEAEPGAHQDLSDLLTSDAQAELQARAQGEMPEDSTAIFTADEVRALRTSAPPAGDLDAELDRALAEPLGAVEPSGMPTSGEFELMIDEDVLVLDDDGELRADDDDAGEPAEASEPSAPPPAPSSAPPASGSQPPPAQKGGFFSRILNRK